MSNFYRVRNIFVLLSCVILTAACNKYLNYNLDIGSNLRLFSNVTTFSLSHDYSPKFGLVSSVTSDGTNLYVTDYSNSNIRKIEIATGTVTTFAGSGTRGSADGIGVAAEFNQPIGITNDGTNLYVADSSHTIRQVVIATGAVTTIAGTAGVSGSANGVGAAAGFFYPQGITSDGVNLYIADSGNNTIRQMVIATGAVTTIAGTAGVSGSANGVGAAARFLVPYGITFDGSDLYIADYGNHTIRRLVLATGAVTTVAGTAGLHAHVDANGAAARFGNPQGITSDGTNLYISEGWNHTIRQMVIATGAVTTLAGNPQQSGYADGIGSSARFFSPQSMALHGSDLYIADWQNNIVRKLVIATGSATTFAGYPNTAGSNDGIGYKADLNNPTGITSDSTNIYIADTDNHIIRKIEISSGIVSNLAGILGTPGSSDGIGALATFDSPKGIITDGTNLYLTDSNNTVRKIVIATGLTTTLAGTAGVSGSNDGIGAIASFNSPTGITLHNSNLYIADSNNNVIRKIVITTGVVTTVAGTAGITGTTDGIGINARFDTPFAITSDNSNLYVTDTANLNIRRISVSTNSVTTINSTIAAYGIATNGTELYITDNSGSTIKRIILSTGIETTLAGTENIASSSDGVISSALLSHPIGICNSSTGLFFTENNAVRKVE